MAPIATATAAATAGPPPAGRPAALVSACEEIAREQRDALAKLDAPPDNPAMAIPKDELSIAPEGLGKCLFAGHGAWSISVLDLEKQDPEIPGASAAVRVVYTGDDGQPLVEPRQTGGYTVARYAVLKSIVYDIDEDGVAELFLCDELVLHSLVGTGFWGTQDIGECAVYDVEDGAIGKDDRKDGLRIGDFKAGNGNGPPEIVTLPD